MINDVICDDIICAKIIVDSERPVYHINSSYLAALICINGRS